MYYDELLAEGGAVAWILKGIQLERPKILISWDTEETDFIDIFHTLDAVKIADMNYFVKDVDFIGEKRCNMGLEFRRTPYRISFSRNSCDGYDDLVKSFGFFQSALENAFGKPIKRQKTMDDFDSCEWKIGDDIEIRHYVMDRFGLAEYLCFKNSLAKL
jgi:hypothetical protein